MSRLVRASLEVKTGPDGGPLEIRFKGRRCRVLEVLDRWCDTGCWWEGEPARLFWRLQLEGGGAWEIYLDLGQGSWYLYKIYD